MVELCGRFVGSKPGRFSSFLHSIASTTSVGSNDRQKRPNEESSLKSQQRESQRVDRQERLNEEHA